MVKNEEDVIEAFVRHNLQFVDCLFVGDNGSADETRGILIKLEQEGLPIVVFDDPIASYVQSEKMSRFLAGIATTVFPDFVVPLDADEFIRCESRQVFREHLQVIPIGALGHVPWVTYVVTPDDPAPGGDDPLRRITHRRREERPPYEKAIVRLDHGSGQSLSFTQGNHSVLRRDGKPLPAVKVPGVALAHFPVRSSDQLTIKAIVGWMACTMRDKDARRSSICFQWRDAFDRVLEHGEIPAAEIPARSMLYAQEERPIDWDRDVLSDPMPFSYTRRYGGGTRGRALATIARSWERSLAPAGSFVEDLKRSIAGKKTASSRQQRPGAKAGATAFDASWHFEHPFVDVAPYRYLAERFRPRSILDIGCGLGATLLFFQTVGADAVKGVDGFPAHDSLLPENSYVKQDLSQPFDVGERFDLVICTEVAEHLPVESGDVLLASVARHAREMILFSAGEEGQPGAGHINGKPIGYWLQRWRELGWVPDEFSSLAFRSLATFSWLRRNPIVLVRAAAERLPAPRASRDLEQVGSLRYRWYSQDPEMFEYPFAQLPPEGVYADGASLKGFIRSLMKSCAGLAPASWRQGPRGGTPPPTS